MTSLAKLDDRTVLVGCKSGDIFQMETLTFDSTLLSTCHTGQVHDIAFPRLEQSRNFYFTFKVVCKKSLKRQKTAVVTLYFGRLFWVLLSRIKMIKLNQSTNRVTTIKILKSKDRVLKWAHFTLIVP